MEKDTTTVSASTFVIFAPGDVRPGHMMLAPLRINLIAPLSTCMCGIINGSMLKSNAEVLQSKRIRVLHHFVQNYMVTKAKLKENQQSSIREHVSRIIWPSAL